MACCTGKGGWRGVGLLAVVLLAACGCDDDRYSREPPPGQGTLYVENYTGSRVEVYIDGAEMDSVRGGRHRHYDLEPGVRRLVLSGRHTPRTWSGDVDVLEGRRTILEVEDAWDYRTYSVRALID